MQKEAGCIFESGQHICYSASRTFALFLERVSNKVPHSAPRYFTFAINARASLRPAKQIETALLTRADARCHN